MTTQDNPDAPRPAEPPTPPAVAPRADGAARTRRRKPRGAARSERAKGLFAPRPRWEKSPAGIVALVAFTWGMSLLVQEWLRTTWFEPRGLSSSLLSAPLFATAVAAALLAARARSAGRPTLGGPAVHRFGLASGLVGATALALALYMAPRMLSLKESARQARARAQLADIAQALEAHRLEFGAHPEGAGAASLQALGKRFADSDSLLDPWGHELEYRSLGSGRGYLLLSFGPNGVADVPLTDHLEEQGKTFVGDDIVVLNGVFRDARSEPGGPLPEAVSPPMMPPPSVPAPDPLTPARGSEADDATQVPAEPAPPSGTTTSGAATDPSTMPLHRSTPVAPPEGQPAQPPRGASADPPLVHRPGSAPALTTPAATTLPALTTPATMTLPAVTMPSGATAAPASATARVPPPPPPSSPSSSSSSSSRRNGPTDSP